MVGRASEELGLLASITAAIEASKTEVTDIEITTADRVCRENVRLSIPLEDVKRLDETRISMDGAQLAEGKLQIDLDIEIGVASSESSEGERFAVRGRDDHETGTGEEQSRDDEAAESRPAGHSDPTGMPQEMDDEESRTRGTAGSQSDTDSSSTITDDSSSDVEADDTTNGEPEVGQTTDRSEKQPVYRDPEELAAVYDPNATFEQMKAELGADVTAQTIRKYMIKYGIHEPKQRPDRLLESIRPSEFELMNDDEGEHSERTDRSVESDPDGS